MRPAQVLVLLIALPIAFNAAFPALAATFGHPDILRRPTDEVLTRFREGGDRLVLLVVGATTGVLPRSCSCYLGVAVGQHLGYLLSGWLGILGVIIEALLALCSLELVGRSSPPGGRLPEP